MLTVKQAADQLGVSSTLIYTLCTRGAIAHERYGLGRGTIRLSQEALDDFRNRCRARAPAAPAPAARASALPRLQHIQLHAR